MPATVDHEIKIRRVGTDAVPPQPMPTMYIGDTVRYTSDDGAVTIKFHDNGSPYQETEISSGQIATVRNGGRFRGRCFITLKDGSGTIGWRADPSLSGADHDIPR